MITLTAKIQLTNNDSNILSATASVEGNNISSDINSAINKSEITKKPFLLGVSKLGYGSTFQTKVPYYISSQLTDSDGKFENPFVIIITGSNLQAITLLFDEENGAYPLEIYINGEKIENNSYLFEAVLSPTSVCEIRIEGLNTPNYPLIIQGIYASLSYTLDSRNLLAMDFRRTFKGTIDMPSFGIISNQGSIEFTDYNQNILEYIEKELIKDNLSCIIELNNTTARSSQQVAKAYAYNWEYDNDNRIVNVVVKDDLVEWQDILIDGINYNPYEIEPTLFSTIYEALYEMTPTKYNMLPFSSLDSNTKEILQKTYCQYPIINSGNLWRCWTKLCVACQLYIYKNSKDQTVCSYTFGA